MKSYTNYSKKFAILLFAVFACLPVIHAQSEEASPPDEITEEVFDAEMARLNLEKEKTNVMLARYMPFIGMGFTIVLLTIIFGVDKKADKNRHETIRRYLELEKEVPPELLIDKNNPKPRKPISDTRKAVIWLAIGLAVALVIASFGGGLRELSVSSIPIFVGLGYLVVSKIDPSVS